ncbi:unnamed protein product [Rotaria sordida]|uniref:Endonuclease/exonuclease/phosphatase domain-containing protein n=1 Tax=Rotaria sordida TaxID=392033 RepID=A0A815RR28_9BILA|nr:unnamed protein product [Rotaria sordida]CAF1481460.1 unnamed protein product [Rotaria sordida]
MEIPESRMTEALKDVGLDAIDVVRLMNKTKKMPTKTIKITFMDPQNRNIFVHTGLQVDSMHFIAEPANQNTKPVQCYLCLKYNHVAKYCKTKQQICAQCGENHRIDQCTAASDALKCCNCKGNHLATLNECATYTEQEKRMQNLINQYSCTNTPPTTAPATHDANEFLPLPNIFQRQQDHLHNELFDEIINVLSISSIYVPPTAKININVFRELYNLNNNCIIVDDLNATLHHMGSRRTNARGKQLQEIINEGYINCIDDDSTTFEKKDYEEKLDCILASQPLLSLISNVETHPTLGALSGHKPLTFDVPIGAEPKPISPRLSLNFKAANWTKFRILLTANDKTWERLQIMQNKAIRAALGLPIYTSVDYIHKISNIPKIKDYAVTLLERSIQTATSNNDNTLKQHLLDIQKQI